MMTERPPTAAGGHSTVRSSTGAAAGAAARPARSAERNPVQVGLDPEQEVAREIDPGDVQFAAAGGLQIEDADRHRQSLPPLADGDQVGVGRVATAAACRYSFPASCRFPWHFGIC